MSGLSPDLIRVLSCPQNNVWKFFSALKLSLTGKDDYFASLLASVFH